MATRDAIIFFGVFALIIIFFICFILATLKRRTPEEQAQVEAQRQQTGTQQTGTQQTAPQTEQKQEELTEQEKAASLAQLEQDKRQRAQKAAIEQQQNELLYTRAQQIFQFQQLAEKEEQKKTQQQFQIAQIMQGLQQQQEQQQ